MMAENRNKNIFVSKEGHNKDVESDVIVPLALVDRLKVNNILQQMNIAVKHDVHNPKTCIECQSKEGEILQKLFLRQCQTSLERTTLSNKVEEHLLANNTVTLVGKLASALPKPTTDSQLIWQRFLKK